MIKARDYVEAVLNALAKDANTRGIDNFQHAPRKFEALVTAVETEISGLKDADHEIVIQIQDGLIQTVTGIPAGVKIAVEDFDTDGMSDEELEELENHGRAPDASEKDGLSPCYRTVYTADTAEAVQEAVGFEPDDKPLFFRNFYKHCGVQWDSVWSGTVNEKCPKCGAEIEPYKSEDA